MYKYIFFDLDHTLWDFDTNCTLALTELYETYNLKSLGITLEIFIATYKKVNAQMWEAYNRKALSKKELRNNRFNKTFALIGINPALISPKINEDFLRICPAKGALYPHTHQILSYLKNKYKMSIITNGFSETQHIKISTSSLSQYFDHIVEAERVGIAKPDRRIFEHAMSLFNSKPEECIMIGDDLYVDIMGAKRANISQIYINRHGKTHIQNVTYEISCLSELKYIL